MRKKIIIGNWKMNKGPNEIKSYLDTFLEQIDDKMNCDFGLAVSSINLALAQSILHRNPKVIICAQDAFYEKNGAFTGNVSWWQIKELGINYSIIGHSERRQMFNDTDEVVNKKVLCLLENEMIPILCVGENLSQRESNSHFQVVEDQLEKDLKNVGENIISNLIIAYEPIWAIGTGKSASSNDAIEMCKNIRKKIEKMYNKDIANKIRIMYGGSVNSDNVVDYLCNEYIDGALVGGASLDAINFIKLIKEIK